MFFICIFEIAIVFQKSKKMFLYIFFSISFFFPTRSRDDLIQGLRFFLIDSIECVFWFSFSGGSFICFTFKVIISGVEGKFSSHWESGFTEVLHLLELWIWITFVCRRRVNRVSARRMSSSISQMFLYERVSINRDIEKYFILMIFIDYAMVGSCEIAGCCILIDVYLRLFIHDSCRTFVNKYSVMSQTQIFFNYQPH